MAAALFRVASLLLTVLCHSSALDNGLSQKPPLGFNTWNYFNCDINEGVVRAAADRLVSLGLVEAGYVHLNLDDCWQAPQRSADGRLQADPGKFPSGLAALGADIHSRGLRFGIYSDAGSKTCAGYPGSRHHEEVDAATFASWGVDFLKYDNCFAGDEDIVQRYTDMRDALLKTGRPIYYSMCNWGRASPWQWAHAVGNSWRTYQDISPTWSSVLQSLDNGAAGLGQHARPGGWNDPDMLEVGVGALSLAQQRSHFALWAVVKSPLLIGANLELIDPDSLAILKSKEVIAINQDDLGVAGDIIWQSGSAEVWAAPLVGNQRAVVLFNRHRSLWPTTIRVTWAQLGYTTHDDAAGFKARVRDLYAERDIGVFEDGFEAAVASHDVVVIRVTPVAANATTMISWRPWSHPSAAALQARKRAASQRVRQWDDRRMALVSFVNNHWTLSVMMAAAVLMGAVVAVGAAAVGPWRRLRARRSSSSSKVSPLRYQSVPQSDVDDMSSGCRSSWSGSASSDSGSPVLQSPRQTASFDGVASV